MGAWNAMTFEGKDNLLRVVRQEAEGMFALAEQPGAWEAPTACAKWQVRDVIGHLVDVTEGYFAAFDNARGGVAAPDPFGLPVMGERLDERAQAFRSVSQHEMLARLRKDFDAMMEIAAGLDADEWSNLTVTHPYMGPLPAFFYPTAQLMDYGVHSWDIRQGTGRAHALSAEVGDLLAPFMLILWQSTTTGVQAEPLEIGIRLGGPNGADYRITLGPDGFGYENAPIDDLPTVIEFDPGSFVLTTFGRINAGAIRGDRAVADRFLNSFFRI
ncbi:MAG TPA: maleylpyruvate isomerase family mycothiol-dependent enzyme [Actinopolymorphaceae bacterium]|nr:maleylpyruvate isomerase family mycothiol-dependent enzyme [Actinopolymorphaceae bacterium]